jgi:parallel beta-helix repeat protein
MRKSVHLTIVVMLVLGILPNSMSYENNNATAGKPDDGINGLQYVDGDWIVNGMESYSNEEIILTGNLTVEAGGHLTLRHVILAMNNTNMDGLFNIEVLSGGTLIITDIDDNPLTTNDFSNITDSPFDVDDETNTDYEYAIRVFEGASFSLTNSLVRECGYDGNDNTGILIMADGAVIENCTLENNRYSVNMDEAENFKIANNHIQNSEMGILVDFTCKEGEIFGNDVHDNFYGIYFQGLNLSIHDNHVYNNEEGLYSKIGFVYTKIFNNVVHDNAISGMYFYHFWSYSTNYNEIYGNEAYNNYIGMYFSGRRTQIYNNFIHNNTEHGVRLSNVWHSEFYDNTLIHNGNSGPEDWRHNLHIDSSDNLTIHNNDIKYLKDFCYYAVMVSWSSNLTFHNNTIVENGNFRSASAMRIDMDESNTNIRVIDNNISNSPARGLTIYGSGVEYNSVEIRNNVILNTNSYSLNLDSLRNYTITDNQLNSPFGTDVFVDDLQGGEFTNNTFPGISNSFYVRDTRDDPDDTFFVVTNSSGPFGTTLTQGYPDISFEYFLHIYVTDQFGPAPDVLVTVENIFAEKVFEGRSGPDGYIRYIRVTNQTQVTSPTGNYTEYYDPHNITASDSGFTAYGENEPRMYKSQTVNVTFDKNLLPEAPSDLTAVSQDLDVLVSWTPSHSPDLSHYLIYRNDSLGAFVLVHDTSGDVDPHQTFYIDPNAASDPTTYWYRVLAIDGIGQQSAFSNVARCGDWAIGDTRTITDYSVQLNGSFIILNTGIVTLNNVHMVFNCSSVSEFGVRVHPFGELHILDGDNDPLTTFDQSNITSLNPLKGFNMNIEGSIFELRNSRISRCGFSPIWLGADWDIYGKAPQIGTLGDPTKAGLYIASTASDVTIEYNEFTMSFVSIMVDGATGCQINNNTFSDNIFGVYTHDASGVKIADNVFLDNVAYSVYLFDSPGNIVERNEITVDPSLGGGNNVAAGIVLFGRGSGSNTIDQNNVYDGDYGICLWQAGMDNVLSNNFLKGHVTNDAVGIYIFNTTFAYLNDNDFNNSYQGCSIFFSDSITASGGSAIGGFFAYYVMNSGNVSISNIYCEYMGWGVVGLFINDLIVINITVKLGGMGGIGFMGGVGVYASDIIVEDAWIALYCVFDLMNVRIVNAVAVKNIEQVFYGEETGGVFIENSTFAGTVLDLNLTETELVLINVTYNQTRIIMDDLSTISINWYIHVRVMDWTGVPVSGAQVQVRKVFGTLKFNGFTNINGYVLWILLHERTQYNITNETSNPHFINVFYGDHTGSLELALNKTALIVVELGNTAPTASNVIITPTLPTTIFDLNLSYMYTDPESDPEGSTQILWYTDGIHNTSLNNLLTIPGSYTQKGQIWFAEVIPHDGAVYGVPMTSTPVFIQNTPPEVANVAIDEISPSSSDNLHISYDFSDIDMDSEGLSLHRWYMDNGSGFGYSGVDAVELDASNTRKGELWKCIVTPSDGEDLGTQMESNVVTIGNTAPEILDASVTPSGFPASNETLVATYSYFDLDFDPESGSAIEWYKDGVLQNDLSGTFQVDPTKTRAGEKWYYLITPSDATDFGIAMQSDSVEIANTPPSVSTITITPQFPSTADDLVAGYVYYDEDGDSESEDTIIKWHRMRPGDIEFSYTGYQGSTLSSTFTTKDEIWKCEIIPHDGLNYGPALLSSVEVTIGNSPPVASDVAITPTSPTTKDDLDANYDYYDQDSDLESDSEISWYRNDVLQSNLNGLLTVSNTETQKGDTWYFTIRPGDGANIGSEVQSPSVDIENSAPEARNLKITPRTPKGEEDIQASFDYHDEDEDPEASFEIRWYKNGLHQSIYDDMLIIESTATEKGDIWFFEIRVADGLTYSATNESYFVEILNSKPKEISISPAPSTITINETESWPFISDIEDPDGDFLLYNWRLNRTSVGTDKYFELTSDYDSHGWYNLSLTVQDIGEDSGSLYYEWIIVVNNINRLPEIEVREPISTNPKMKEGDSLRFIIDESDPDTGESPDIIWYLDDGVAQTGGSSYTYVAGELASGKHEVKAVVDDGTDTTEYTWDLSVQDVAAEELFGLSYDAWGLIMAIISGLVAMLLFVFGLYRVRRRKGALKTYMAEIDEISTRQDENPIVYQNQLNELEEKINSDFRAGNVEDLHYLMLQEILATRRGDVRKAAISQKFEKLPEGVASELDDMLKDGKITKDEYQSFVATMNMTKSLTGDQKKELSKMIEKWEFEDKDLVEGDSPSEKIEPKKDKVDENIEEMMGSEEEKKED